MRKTCSICFDCAREWIWDVDVPMDMTYHERYVYMYGQCPPKEKGIAYHEFLDAIPKRMGVLSERYGQAMFNLLVLARPMIAEKLRATELDPFYKDKEDILPETWTLIASEWDQ